MKETNKNIKTVFVDRDGVVNRRLIGDWVKSWEEFDFLPKVHEALALLKEAGYQTILITNQRGISLDLMSVAELEAIHAKMQASLAEFDAEFDAIYLCPHGREDHCDCRKPAPGMLLKAMEDYNLKPEETVMIGDSVTDGQAAEAAECRSFYFVDESTSLYDHVREFV